MPAPAGQAVLLDPAAGRVRLPAVLFSRSDKVQAKKSYRAHSQGDYSPDVIETYLKTHWFQ